TSTGSCGSTATPTTPERRRATSTRRTAWTSCRTRPPSRPPPSARSCCTTRHHVLTGERRLVSPSGMSRRHRSLLALEVAVVVAAFVIPLLVAADGRDLPPPIQVSVTGKGPVLLDAGTTLGKALKGLGLRPKSGNL